MSDDEGKLSREDLLAKLGGLKLALQTSQKDAAEKETNLQSVKMKYDGMCNTAQGLQSDLSRSKGLLSDKINIEKQYKGEVQALKKELATQQSTMTAKVDRLEHDRRKDGDSLYQLQDDLQWYAQIHGSRADYNARQNTSNITGRGSQNDPNNPQGNVFNPGTGSNTKNTRRLTLPLFDVPMVGISNETFCPIKLGAPVVAQTNAISPKCTMPPNFEGTEWYQYLIQFENIATSNAWDDDTKKRILVSKCRGDAATALSGLDLTMADWGDVVTLMCKMYGVGTSEEREQKFKMRKQQLGEDHQTFALKLRTLALWAFPESADDTVNRLLMQQFIAGLLDKKVAYEVHIRQPKSLFEATEIVSRIQSSLKMVYGANASLESLYGVRDEWSSCGSDDEDEMVEAVMNTSLELLTVEENELLALGIHVSALFSQPLSWGIHRRKVNT